MLVPFHAIGGNGGRWTEFVGGRDGSSLEYLKVFAGGWQLRGIYVRLTNGRDFTFGEQVGPARDYTFKVGERFKRLSLWGNGAGSRAGWIEFETTTGGFFSYGMNEWGRKSEYPMEVGSGICVGLYGNSGADVDAIGFAFLQELKSARLLNIEFPAAELEAISLPPLVVIGETKDNGSDVNQTYTFSAEFVNVTRDVFTTEGTLEATIESSMEVSVEGKLPEVAGATGKMGEKVGVKTSMKVIVTRESQASVKTTHTMQIVGPPHKRIVARAVVYSGPLTMNFTGTMRLTTKDGESMEFPVRGTYTGVRTSQVFENVRQMEIPSEALDHSEHLVGSV